MNAPLVSSRTETQAGFTLIEILVTLALTMVALAGLLSLNVAITRGNATAAQSSEAVAITKSVMEEIRAAPATSLGSTGPFSTPSLRDGRNTTFVIQATYQGMTLIIGDPPNSTFKIRVEVSWLENAEKLAAGASASDILQFGPGGSAANGVGCDPTVGCSNFHRIALETMRSTRNGI